VTEPVATAEEEAQEGLTTIEKWEIASIVVGVVFTVAYGVYLFSELSEGQGNGPVYRLRWRLDQARRRRAEEAEFQKANAHLQYEAWEIVTSAHA
jgi:hypothetical protein